MDRPLISILFLALSVVFAGCAQKRDPLLRATQDGDVSTVGALLDGGADVNYQGELALRAGKEHPDLIELLKKAGAKQ